jgi:peptide/nickel transport system ATP-binding protein
MRDTEVDTVQPQTESQTTDGREPESDVKPILEVRDLHVHYETVRGPVQAVRGLSFDLMPNEILGLAGESGSGKSTLAMALLRMIKPPGAIVQGEIRLDGRDILSLSESEMRQVRLADIAMVAQGAMNSLNPVMRIQDQIKDAWADHGIRYSRREADDQIASLLQWVGLRPEVARVFPHELSGGMKQRVVIAIAISMRPRVIIADEPTSALDVVVQRQIISTLRRVQDDLQAAVILIGHDIGLMAQSVQKLGIMYAGKVAEMSPIYEMFEDPMHPYTQLLIESLPSPDQKGELKGIPGITPSLLNPPRGCAFHARCPYAMERCTSELPMLEEKKPDRMIACHLFSEEK